MKSTVKFRQFVVHIPNLEGDDTVESVPIRVPVEIDPVTGQEILTEEAFDLIEKTKARRLGIMLPGEIRALRQRLNVTQEEMSELLQIGAKSYTRWESGRARVSRSMNVILCALRDGVVTIEYLRALRSGGIVDAFVRRFTEHDQWTPTYGWFDPASVCGVTSWENATIAVGDRRSVKHKSSLCTLVTRVAQSMSNEVDPHSKLIPDRLPGAMHRWYASDDDKIGA